MDLKDDSLQVVLKKKKLKFSDKEEKDEPPFLDELIESLTSSSYYEAYEKFMKNAYFHCNICNNKTYYGHLSTYQEVHTNLKLYLFCSLVCKNVFLNQEKDKIYACSYCGQDVFRKEMLKIEQRKVYWQRTLFLCSANCAVLMYDYRFPQEQK